MAHVSHCAHSFHYLKDAFFDFSNMFSTSQTDPGDWLSRMLHFATQNPIKFVAVLSMAVTGAVPVGVFLLYAAGTIVCTLVAAVVLDVALLACGVFVLALVLCCVGCITGGVAGIFSIVYFGYKAATSSVSKAKARLAPSTITPSSHPPPSSSSPAPTDSDADEAFDKNKHHSVMTGLSTGLTTFLTSLFSLSGIIDSDTDTDVEEDFAEQEDERQSDICRTSLIVFGLTFSVVVMSYVVLVAAYLVINFT